MSARANAHGTCAHENCGQRPSAAMSAAMMTTPMPCMPIAVIATPARREAIAAA